MHFHTGDGTTEIRDVASENPSDRSQQSGFVVGRKPLDPRAFPGKLSLATHRPIADAVYAG
jgi:hypothetical protein